MISAKSDFPIFKSSSQQRPLVYLDSGASAQKPSCVVDKMNEVLSTNYANIHRGLYKLSQDVTQAYEQARSTISDFIGAASSNELIFTRNATESLNLIASSWGSFNLKAGDEIILTEMEHHANIVPWQLLRDKIGIHIKVIPVSDDGLLQLDVLDELLSTRTRVVSFTQVSNALGTCNNVNKISKIIRSFNPEIKICVDGSQAVVHRPVNMQDLDCDFYVFTGHKLYGPTGIGCLWAREETLNAMPPYQGGGDMIERVTFEKTTYQNSPARFEAGTPAIVEAIGLAEAVTYMQTIGMQNIQQHEGELYRYMLGKVKQIDGLKLYADHSDKAAILSFTADWAHISDIAMILDQCGVCVRTGHHCCMPLMQRYGIEGTVRASMGVYNDTDDVDIFIDGLNKAKRMLS